MKTQTKTLKLSSPAAQAIYEELQAAGYRVNVNKKEYAEIVGCSVSAVDHYLSKGYGIPQYKKIGHQRNARVLFGLRDVAEYLAAQMIVTV